MYWLPRGLGENQETSFIQMLKHTQELFKTKNSKSDNSKQGTKYPIQSIKCHISILIR